MPILAGSTVAGLADRAGVIRSQLVMAVAIAWAESGLNSDAVGENRDPVTHLVTSRDRGLWQINDYWHPDVSDACAFDPTCNAQAMSRISSNGNNWNPWSTYLNGAYQRYLAMAQLAVNYYLTGSGGAGGPSGGGSVSGYRVTAGSGLIVHAAADVNSPRVGAIGYNQVVTIQCQDRGSNVGGSSIWDHITSPINGWVSDYYINTPVFNGFTPGIARCSAPAPSPTPTPPSPTTADVANLLQGKGPIAATAAILQRLVDETMDWKYGEGHRTGPIFGGIIQ